jgi:hypothetical protein
MRGEEKRREERNREEQCVMMHCGVSQLRGQDIAAHHHTAQRNGMRMIN